MSEDRPTYKRHFVFSGTGITEPFQRRGGAGKQEVPRRDRRSHGNSVLRQVESLRPELEQAKLLQEESGVTEYFGLQIEFESFPGVELAFESLAAERSGIELLNVHHVDDKTLASVFIPEGKLIILERKIKAYLEKDTPKGAPRNQKLIDTIHNIRVASIRSLWTDDWEVFPTDPKEAFWWEVWLPVRKDRAAVVRQFRQTAERLGFRVDPGQIEFPERTVLLMFGTLEQLSASIIVLNSIAELRRAKETADFFDSLPPEEQPEWANDLLQRMTVPEEGASVPYICLLDTGVNQSHPLLMQAISTDDCHTVKPGWGTNDNAGHGTEMAGLALLGDLTQVMESSNPVQVSHRLESVKLLNQLGTDGGDPEHHGYLTIQAVSYPEIASPHRLRVFSMAVTARDARDRGKPSAWSAALDRLAADAENHGEAPRLFLVAAGNVERPTDSKDYPDSNTTDGIHDPGQAWNALTVGAMTQLVHITEADAINYHPVAPTGGLSPFSTTSQTWQPHRPLKPDVVFEGGNTATDGISAVWLPSLSLLTTNAEITARLFTTTRATSAATSLAARMAARLMADYPELRTETIRGLIVHSAEWTQEMKRQFLTNPSSPSKREVESLVRHCGFGQPDLERALWSMENSLTLICEDSLQPFKREDGKEPTLHTMNLHRLPWPLPELESLGETEVEMRVTLSYFIEPNPSTRGVKSRYRYESHGLRFDVKRPHESEDEFRRRINMAARDEEEAASGSSGDDQYWLLGTRRRHRGSIHSDIWRGPAVDLASRGALAVYPVSGWWKTRPKLEQYNRLAYYSLLVSIRAPKVDVSLYSAIENQLRIKIKI